MNNKQIKTKTNIRLILALLVVSAVFLSGCVGQNKEEEIRHNTSNVTTKILDDNGYAGYWWGYGYPYRYGPPYVYPSSSYSSLYSPNTPRYSSTNIISRPSTEEGWSIKRPEVVRVTEELDENGKEKITSQNEEYSDFIEPREPEGYKDYKEEDYNPKEDSLGETSNQQQESSNPVQQQEVTHEEQGLTKEQGLTNPTQEDKSVDSVGSSSSSSTGNSENDYANEGTSNEDSGESYGGGGGSYGSEEGHSGSSSSED